MTLIVDYTHTYRDVTGVERIANELFSPDNLSPFESTHVYADGLRQQLRKQLLDLPALALRNPRSVFLTPTFPPSVVLTSVSKRIIPYVHDLLLGEDDPSLNWRARLYLRPSFRRMLSRCNTFFVNSHYTEEKLRIYKPNAKIVLFRPKIENSFGISAPPRMYSGEVVNFLTLGTVEPRKNLLFAADIVSALNAMGIKAILNVAGRKGWGPDWDLLANSPNVNLHGYLDDTQISALVAKSDALLFVSKEEGLGLPVLELQYSHLPTFVSNIAAFKETLGVNAEYVSTTNAVDAATRISSVMNSPEGRIQAAANTKRVLKHYFDMADHDRETAFELLEAKLSGD